MIMDDFIDVNEYKKLNTLRFKEVYTFLIILSFLFFTVTLIILNSKFDYIYSGFGITENNNFKISLKSDELQYVVNNSKIIINKKNYTYTVKSISSPIIDFTNTIYIKEVILNINKFKSIDNNIIKFKIQYDKKSGFKIIKEFLTGKGK